MFVCFVFVLFLFCFVFCFFFSVLDQSDDCLTDTQLCDTNAICQNIKGFQICTCIPGYNGNGKICAGNYQYPYDV